MKAPIMCEESNRFSYRIYDEELVLEMLNEQTAVPIKMEAAYTESGQLFAHASLETRDPVADLQAARKRARNPRGAGISMPKILSTVVIGLGEGRRTREFEIQWWPDLYQYSFGKLVFRFYVSKVHL